MNTERTCIDRDNLLFSFELAMPDMIKEHDILDTEFGFTREAIKEIIMHQPVLENNNGEQCEM